MMVITMNTYEVIGLAANISGVSILLRFVAILCDKENVEDYRKAIAGFAIIFGVIGFVLDHFVQSATGRVCVYFLFFLLFCHIFYRTSYRLIALYLTSYIMILVAFELLVTVVVMMHYRIEFAQMYEIAEPRSVYLITSRIAEIAALPLTYRIPTGEQKDKISKKIIGMLMGLFWLLISMTIVFIFYHCTGHAREFVSFFYLMLCLGLAILAVYLFSIFLLRGDKKKKIETLHSQNEMLRETLEENQRNYEYWEQNIHDYKNTILCLRGMLQESGQQNIQEYLDKEFEQIQEKDHVVKCGNGMIDSVLSMKWVGANSRGVYFSIQGHLEEKLPIPDIQFGKIMGNLIDNAVEGALQSGEDAYVEVILYQKSDYLMAEINNSSKKERIHFEKTSKKNSRGHGLGLHNVRRLVQEYDGFFSIKQDGDHVAAIVEF